MTKEIEPHTQVISQDPSGATRLLQLRGKYAFGEHAYARVDESDFAWLSQWAWRAQPNHKTVYAVRTETSGGKQRKVWMHREILGLGPDDSLETDHINHNGLDNRRCNLRPATRVENRRNERRELISGCCVVCGTTFTVFRRPVRKQIYCSKQCRYEGEKSPSVQHARAGRLLAALREPITAKDAANEAGMCLVSAWRLLKPLVDQGTVTIAEKRTNRRGPLYRLARQI